LSSARICGPAAEAGLTASRPNDAAIFHAARPAGFPKRCVRFRGPAAISGGAARGGIPRLAGSRPG